jgi:hypothetical protein
LLFEDVALSWVEVAAATESDNGTVEVQIISVWKLSVVTETSLLSRTAHSE